MNGRQVAAVVAAVALIAGAFGIRRVLDDGDDGTTDPTETTTATPARSGEVVCITELAAVCDELRSTDPELTVRTESAFATLDRLAAQDDGIVPTWVTVAPFPAMVDSLRAGNNRDPFELESTEVAASQLAIAVPATSPAGRAEAIAATCGPNTWRCVGDADNWQSLGVETDVELKIGIGDADRSVVALASLAIAAAGYFDLPDVSSSSLQADPAFGTWLGRLARSASLSSLSGGTPLPTMLTRPGAVNVAATSVAEVAAFPATTTGAEVNYPEPAMWLQAVVARPAGTEPPEPLTSTAAEVLVAAGWDEADQAGNPLPSASTMLALRVLWQEAV